MNIPVEEIINCTWVLDGDTFYCTHDERRIESFTQDHMGFDGHYQTEEDGYVCADVDCDEVLEGSPAEDRAEAMVDYEMDCD